MRLQKELEKLSTEEYKVEGRVQYPVKIENKWDKERWEKVQEGIKLLADAANSGNVNQIAPMMVNAIQYHHRTLQQELIESLLSTIDMYADARWDGRNKAAVAMCRIASEDMNNAEIVIPKQFMRETVK